MSEIFGMFKRFLSDTVECIVCKGKGKMAAPRKGEFDLVFHTEPSKATPPEMATAMLMASSLMLGEKLGVDPSTVHIEIKFTASDHRICFGLDRAKKEGKP